MRLPVVMRTQRGACHATVTEVVEKRWKTANKGERGREVGSLVLHSNLLILLGKTSAPVKCNELIQMSVNRMLGITVPILSQNPTFSIHSSYF